MDAGSRWRPRMAEIGSVTDRSFRQASGKDVAALTSIPLMKSAATNVETERKASAVISGLPLVAAARHCVANRPLERGGSQRPAGAMAVPIVSTRRSGIDQALAGTDEFPGPEGVRRTDCGW